MSKKKFLCILRSEGGHCETSETPSPTDMEAMYAKYEAWQKTFADNILDMGGALGVQSAVVSKAAVVDGPFAETKEIVGGYMFLLADKLEDAVNVINQSPMIENPKVSIEIRDVTTP